MKKFYVKIGEFERVGMAEDELEAALAAYRQFLLVPASVDTNMTEQQQTDVLKIPTAVYISERGFRHPNTGVGIEVGDTRLTTHYLTQVMLKRQNQFDPDYDVDDNIPYAEGVDEEPGFDYNE